MHWPFPSWLLPTPWLDQALVGKSFMSDMLTIAIAGIGLAGRRHADAIDQLHGIELGAIIDPEQSGRDQCP